LLIADQGDGELITVARPASPDRKETAFAAGANKPSGVVRCPWQGRDTIFIAGTYGLELTAIQGERVFAISHRGVGTGIVDYAQDRVNGTHTGFHGLEWDGEYLWGASPPGKALFKMKLEDTPGGPAITSASWFPVAAGNRPHGLAWADEQHTELWCNDTTIGAVYRYDARTGACLEVLVLPAGAPVAHGLTMVRGELWYCEDNTALICKIIPLN
jgi:streptogramin lyase